VRSRWDNQKLLRKCWQRRGIFNHCGLIHLNSQDNYANIFGD
jgi:hypothetical protein